ncbi:MAG: sodium:proton antiporter [Phycisphaerales bacterium]
MTATTLAAAESSHGALTHTVEVTVAMLSVAVAIGVLTKFVRVPYTIALVLVGLAIALIDAAPAGAVMTHDLVLMVFLPPLLFQAGLHLDLAHLKRVATPVVIMAFPGVLLSTLLVALTFRWLLPPDFAAMIAPLADVFGADRAVWIVVLLFGVVMAPTDPISVMATFKTANVPDELKTMVEGESLFNDGTAVAVFALLASIVGGVLAGTADAAAVTESLQVSAFAINFIKVAGLGTVIGLGLGLIAFWLVRLLDDHTLETAITVALAWGAFVIAEQAHASGVIAVVVAALIMGNYGRVMHMSDSTRRTLHGFWDSIDFIINSILFLMIGFELSDPAVGGREALLDGRVWLTAFATLAALMIARALLTYPIVMTLKRQWPAAWKHVIWWAGLKGSLSLALLLILPAGDLRSFLLPIAFLVVLLSLVGQGVTMPILIRRLGVAKDAPDATDHT